MEVKRIHKFIIKETDKQIVQIQGFQYFLKAAEQNGNLCVWCMVDTSQKHEYPAEITLIGTGNPIENDYRVLKAYHIDTVLMSHGLVWHIFGS
jgi:uncharacterized protein CbrC (UPF0167 family)